MATDNMHGTLYIVATPIGNLSDISYRAIEILSQVEIIFCEDTRTTKNLLNHYNIKTKTQSYHSHSSEAKEDQIISYLKNGNDVALVSDAGTPTISDPGILVVERVYEEFGNDAKVISIPGPSALITALAGSGINAKEFTYLGFLPHKKGRESLFKEMIQMDRTVVFYESKHRILKTLESIEKYMPDRFVVLARELTKIHEEYMRGFANEIKEVLTNDSQRQKGEFVVIISRDNKNFVIDRR